MFRTARLQASIFVCKALQLTSRVLFSGGSALPGLVMKYLYPDFLSTMLGQLPEGFVIITGTNGKTTTTKAIATMLEQAGKTVLTNRSGSNFTRGIAAAILNEAGWLRHSLPHDIAVLEVDEAYAARVVKLARPRLVVALNVSRDQLDRFVEIDMTAELIAAALTAASQAVVINADDPRLASLATRIPVAVRWFGADESLRSQFNDEESIGFLPAPDPIGYHSVASPHVVLKAYTGTTVTYESEGRTVRGTLTLRGGYNYLNGAAALATAQLLLPGASLEQLFAWLSRVQPAFGRGEVITTNSQDIELVLVKNPASFRQNLSLYGDPIPTAIALNDAVADGRDVSWIWDIDFSPLRTRVPILVGGSRAYDMAVRLSYDDIPISTTSTSLVELVHNLLQQPGDRKRIYCTYTAMLSLRKVLDRHASSKIAL